MNIAVTGANGFIGRHVLAALRARGQSCTAVDLHPPPDTLRPLADRWVQLDIHHPPAPLYEALGRPGVCIHLVWSGLDNYRSLHHFERELPGQYRFLSTLIREGLPALVVSGTCLEYGMKTGELNEEMETAPATAYGFAKDALRRQLQFLRGQTPYALTWGRLFYVFGEGQSSRSLWPQLRQAVARGDARFPMSGGLQVRDYLPIETVADYLVSLAQQAKDVGTVNICSGQPVTVRELVTTWISANGWSIEPEYGRFPYPDYEPMAFWGSAAKLAECQGAEAASLRTRSDDNP